MVADFKAQTHLLQVLCFGIALVLLLLFGLLILVFTPVYDLSNWRVGIGRNLYEIKLMFPSKLERFITGQNAYLLAVLVNNP